MITQSEMYWLTRLDHINLLFLWIMLSCILTIIIFGLAQLILRDNNSWESKEKVDRQIKLADKLLFKGLPTAASILLLVALVRAFVPTTKEMAAIKVVPIIANSEAVGKLGDSATTLIDLANAWMEELKPNKIKQNKDKNEKQ